MSQNRPNILLITTDQQRGDCVGLDPHGPDVLQTPNLDFLARAGTHFHHGYAECPSCIPARRTLMSGMAPAANGMVGFTGAEWNPPATLAGELTKLGYQTHLVGKVHLQPTRKRYGFERLELSDATRGDEANNEYVAWLRRTHGLTDVDPGMAHGISSNGWVGRPHHLPEEQMHTYWCFNQAMEFLQRRDPTVPYFLAINMIDPHPPLTPPAHYYERYINRDLPAPVVGDWAKDDFSGPEKGLNPNESHVCLDEYDMQCARAAYYGMVNFIDDQIGRLIQYAGLRDTFILFTSDHGEMLGDHNRFRKCWPNEASARVPFIARAPRGQGFRNDVVCESPVGLQDVMPTLIDAAGGEVPESCTGKSLLPIMRGETDGVRDVLHGEHSGCYKYEHGNQWLTDGHQKYIWYTQTGREHLFDLDNDPHETHDLALDADSEQKLAPWRDRMIKTLDGRPEGFADGGKLNVGCEHSHLLPGYDPNETYPFV